MRKRVSGYIHILQVLFAVAPVFMIVYVQRHIPADLLFDHHLFHIVAIAISILAGLAVTAVAWRCYAHSGEPFQRWLTLGLLGFTLIYAFHGVFTPWAEERLALFVLYGPVSRLVMAACLLLGVVGRGTGPEPLLRRQGKGYWLGAVGIFLIIDAVVAVVALSPVGSSVVLRLGLELSALVLLMASLVTLVTLVARGVRSPLLVTHGIALAWFAQSCLAFMLASPWNHLWWLAHLIFAAGFLLVSYAIGQAYLTTRSFLEVYSYADLIEQVSAEKARAEQALAKLQQINEDLNQEVATDPLTGVANRRGFMDRARHLQELREQAGSTFSILIVDLDYFKQINDRYGHLAGDAALQLFAKKASAALRPGDFIGRIGGEEFAILLPGSNLANARAVAERLRHEIQAQPFALNDVTLNLTISVGCVEAGAEAHTLQECLDIADQCMYEAKRKGRNRVE